MSIAENSIKERLAALHEKIMQTRREEHRLRLELLKVKAGEPGSRRLWELRDSHPELADLSKEEIDAFLLGAGEGDPDLR